MSHDDVKERISTTCGEYARMERFEFNHVKT